MLPIRQRHKLLTSAKVEDITFYIVVNGEIFQSNAVTLTLISPMSNSSKLFSYYYLVFTFKFINSLFFSYRVNTLYYTPIFLIHIFSINRNHSSTNTFSIYIYACPVNLHSHLDWSDRFRPDI